MDRDDTLIEDPGYINHPDQVKLLKGTAESLIKLKSMGYKLIVVSNQSGVARGIVTEKTLGQIHDRLEQLLAERGASLDGIYYCPFHPEGTIAKYRKSSDMRKPKPGMLLAAADEMDIDLAESWMIGNSLDDIKAGARAGCKTILISRSSYYKQIKPGGTVPDHKCVNMREAVNVIKKHLRSSNHLPKPTAAPVTSTPEMKLKNAVKATQAEEKHEDTPEENHISGNTTHHLLNSILEQMKNTQRTDMFVDFSIMRMLAGIVQMIVLLCLLISVWFLMSPARQNDQVLISLGFAMVLQMMALTFYIMQRRK